MSRKIIIWISVGVLISIWILGKIHSKLQNHSNQSLFEQRVAEAKEVDKTGVLVRAAQIQKRIFREQIPAQGTVSGTKIQLRFEIPGVLRGLNLEPGKLFKKGELLASLQEQDALLKIQYRQAKEEAAKSQLTAAENKFKMFTDLYGTGYLLAAKLDEVRLEKENKQSEFEAARLEVESARKEYEKLFLLAPCDGVVSEKESAVGEFLPAGTKVGTMVDLKDLYLELNVTERYLDKVQPGQTVKFSTHSYQDEQFVGTVEAVVPVIEGKSRTLTAKVKLHDLDKHLIPGMYVKGWVTVYEKPETVVVQNSLLQRQGEAVCLAVVTPENKVALRPVKLGYVSQDETEILDGVRAGEWLITDFPRPLQDGEAVRVARENS